MTTSLDSQLKRLRKRVRFLLAERYGLFGAAIGAVVSAVLVMLSSRYDALLSYPLWAATVILGFGSGIAYGLLKRLDDLTVAMAADKRTGLKERLSTAVAFNNVPRDGMEDAVVTDAGDKISGLSSAEVFRHRYGLPHIVCIPPPRTSLNVSPYTLSLASHHRSFAPPNICTMAAALSYICASFKYRNPMLCRR